jgi:coniferyl-aldehyde dehydrogenase
MDAIVTNPGSTQLALRQDIRYRAATQYQPVGSKGPSMTHNPPQPLTDLAQLNALCQRQRQAFAAAPFPSLAQRKDKLRRLIAALQKHQNAIVDSVNADFGVRSPSETRLVEVLGPVLHARHALSHLRRWMKPRRRSTELLFLTNQAWVETQPKGVVGIIGPWNFPFYLTVGPLVTALAAGNRAMIKTSEFAPRSSALLRQILAECFDEDEVAICEGGPEVAQAFTRLPLDHLVFTGSPRVGRDVMRAAADNLTPVTLELGGKSPAIVGPQADLRDAALRIAHGKAFNAGQICVAPDYALVPRGQATAFAQAVNQAWQRLYPGISANPDYTSIITERHAQRLRSMLQEAEAGGAQLLRCGSDTGQGRQLPLTVVTGASADMQLMREEIFGPILPVVEYDRLEDAMAFIGERERPLSLYGFGLSAEQRQTLLRGTHAGGMTFDDWGWHVFQHDMPFGGIGNSGMGSYHGEEGFRELSHGKSVMRKHRWFPVALFYPPYGNLVQRLSMWFYLGRGH